MIFTICLCIISRSVKYGLNILINLNRWRVVRAGRRSTTGNRVNGQNRFEGSNPLLSAKNVECYRKVMLYIFYWNKRDSNPTRRSRTQSGQRACEREGQSPSNPLLSAKIDKFRQKLVDFTFSLLTLHFSLFSNVDFGK